MANKDMGRKSRNESRDELMDRDDDIRGRADEKEEADETEEFDDIEDQSDDDEEDREGSF